WAAGRTDQAYAGWVLPGVRGITLPCLSIARTHDRLRLDLHQHVGIDEARHLHHAGGRTDRPEELAVRPADLLPARDVRDVHPRPHDVRQAGPRLAQRALDVAKGLQGLGVGVPLAHD